MKTLLIILIFVPASGTIDVNVQELSSPELCQAATKSIHGKYQVGPVPMFIETKCLEAPERATPRNNIFRRKKEGSGK